MLPFCNLHQCVPIICLYLGWTDQFWHSQVTPDIYISELTLICDCNRIELLQQMMYVAPLFKPRVYFKTSVLNYNFDSCLKSSFSVPLKLSVNTAGI